MATYDKRWRRVRLIVLKRDDYCCYYCGGTATTVDHIQPISKGGSMHDEHNLVAACLSCNSGKKDRTTAPGAFFRSKGHPRPPLSFLPPNQTERVPSPFKQPD
jgi:5-methylcytosine-specific restriction endonuclease McrA